MASVAYWDVDTQVDFMLPGGKLYVQGAEKMRPNLKKLYSAARRARIPVVATGCAHLPTDEEMREWPLHCLKGTEGQKKLPETVMYRRITVPHDQPVDAPDLRGGIQVILEKCHLDAFTNPCAQEVVRRSGIGSWIVFGVATDYCVRLSVLGLLKLDRQVTVVSDSIRGVADATSEQAVIEMKAAGADFRSTASVLKTLSPPKPRRPRKKTAGKRS